jgi:DNA-binding XRE family transcriptional regulator
LENRIEEKRRALETLSKSELARQAEISRPYLDMIIKGECVPSADKAIKICKALGTKFEDVFYL